MGISLINRIAARFRVRSGSTAGKAHPQKLGNRTWKRGIAFLAVFTATGLSILPSATAEKAVKRKTSNVLMVLIDGLRWQEVYRGADESLMNKEAGGVPDAAALRKEFWRETPEARREALMPFLWGTVAKQGQLFGNRDKGSRMRVTNGLHFSYPGYSEMICGFPDPRIDSNAKRPNPNVTVFEWLHGKKEFQNRVAVFGAWDVVPWIVNRERCGYYVNGGFEPVTQGKVSPRQDLLNTLKAQMTKPWDVEPYDAITVHSAAEYLKDNRPRVLWLTFGETDEWAHERRYDRVLEAARLTDAGIRTLWETAQSMPQYPGKTTLIVGVDHGRGRTAQDWTSHGVKYPGADEVWAGVLGPDTPALGERTNVEEVTQSQMAATAAAALGYDYKAAVPKAGAPLPVFNVSR